MGSVLFTAEESGETFELKDSDLPKEMQTGAKLRKTVSRYSGDYASVQVHGTELKPIDFEGVFDDTWAGEAGHALEMRDTIDALVALGEIVRMEYGKTELWGTLDAEFVEKNSARITYRITFEPYWRKDPSAQIYIAFAEPPNDLAELLDSRLASTASFFEAAPDGLDLSFVGDIVLGLASVRNVTSNILGYVSKVADYADLTSQQIGFVVRSGLAAQRTLSSVKGRLQGAGQSLFIGETAPAWLGGGEYITEGSRRVDQSIEDLVAMLRKFLSLQRPIRQRTHIVREGDTLQALAKLYLGDFSRWTEIADANDLDSTTLVTGSVLKIPRR
jgi:hypothetical protein